MAQNTLDNLHALATANALVDFWQANASGTYEQGYNLRGHQYTDADGYYTLTTVAPGLYPGHMDAPNVHTRAN